MAKRRHVSKKYKQLLEQLRLYRKKTLNNAGYTNQIIKMLLLYGAAPSISYYIIKFFISKLLPGATTAGIGHFELLNGGMLGLCIASMTIWQSFRFDYHVYKRNFVRLERADRSLPGIHDMVMDLSISMDLKTEVVLWKSPRSFYTLPSTISKNSRGHIVIPGGFVSIYKTSRSQAKSILAHELGHIKNEDTELWLQSTILTVVIYNGLVAMLAIQYLIFFFSLLFPQQQGRLFPDLMHSVLVTLTLRTALKSAESLQKSIVDSLHISELSADLLSVQHADGNALIQVLESHPPHANRMPLMPMFHPTNIERIANIKKFAI